MKTLGLETLEQAREFFKKDRFATENGMTIESVEPGHSVIRLELDETHLNAAGALMGGVPFTMADFACAVAANFGPDAALTVSTNASIGFMSPCRGKVLFAEAVRVKKGRNLSFYEVSVKDDAGSFVARASFTMFCK